MGAHKRPIVRRGRGRLSNIKLFMVDSSLLVVERIGPPGEIHLLREVNSNRRLCRFVFDEELRIPWDEMQVGDSLFIPGYTTNNRDTDPDLRKVPLPKQTPNNPRLWTCRAVAENGLKGVRVYRES